MKIFTCVRAEDDGIGPVFSVLVATLGGDSHGGVGGSLG